MNNLIPQYPQYPQSNQAPLKVACDTWRLPYWDWAAKKPQPSGNSNYSVLPNCHFANIGCGFPQAKVSKIFPTRYTSSLCLAVRLWDSTELVNRIWRSLYATNVLRSPIRADYRSFENTTGASRREPSTDDDGWVQGVETNDDITATLRDPNSDPGDWTQALGTIADAVHCLFTAEYMTNYEAFATARFGPS